MASKTIDILVRVKGNAEKQLKKVSASLGGMSKRSISASTAIKGLAVAGAGLVIFNKANKWIEESVRLARIQEDAERRLTVAYGKSIKGLKEYASALQKKTTFGDEETIQAMARIADFIKEEDQIKAITKATQDFATAKGMDLATTADLVTKTIASETNALSRYGIVVEGAKGSTERTASAVEALNKAFGGTAEAMALTSSGQIDQLDNAIGDLREEVGIKLNPALLEWKQTQAQIFSYILSQGPAINSTLATISHTIEMLAIGGSWLAFGEKANELKILASDDKKYAEEWLRLDNKRLRAIALGLGFHKVYHDEAVKSIKDLESARALHVKEKEAIQGKVAEMHRQATLQRMIEAGIIAGEDALNRTVEAYDEATEAVKRNQAQMAQYGKSIGPELPEYLTGGALTNAILDTSELVDTSLQDAKDKQEQMVVGAFNVMQTMANSAQNVLNAVNNNRQSEYDKEVQRRKDDVKGSTMSAKQKAKALKKIDEDAQKVRHEMRMKEWRQSLIMSLVNTALGVTKTIATMGMPAGIPGVIATGIAGAVSTGIIVANKPKAYNGRLITNRQGMTGDVNEVVVRNNEEILTPDDPRNVRNGGKNGGSTQISVGGSTINLNGPTTTEQLDRAEGILNQDRQATARMLEDMFRNNEINPAIINGALA